MHRSSGVVCTITNCIVLPSLSAGCGARLGWSQDNTNGNQDSDPIAVCGNGEAEPDETCDGADRRDYDCADFGYYEGQLACQQDCAGFSLASCHGYCGDGTINGPEHCDGVLLDGVSCPSLGYQAGATPICTPDCHMDVSPCCGDGIAGANQACDGSALHGQTCATIDQGFFGGQLGCTDHCQLDVSQCNLCGDGTCASSESALDCRADCGIVDVAGSSCSNLHNCALIGDGTVWCWGAITRGSWAAAPPKTARNQSP